MKHELLILSSLLLGSLGTQAALAQGVPGTDSTPLTRAEVKAEAKRAEAAGEISKGDVVTPPALQKIPPSTTTRAAVQAEAKRAEAAGEIPKGDVVEPDAAKKPPPSTTTRAEVNAELRDARARGRLPGGDIVTPEVLQDQTR